MVTPVVKEEQRRAADIADRLLFELTGFLPQALDQALTEKQITDWLWQRLRAHGADSFSFPPIVALGEHAAIPHHEPIATPLTPGHLLLVDLGVVVDGWCSDITRCFALGELDSATIRTYQRVADCHAHVLRHVKVGVTMWNLQQVAIDFFKTHGVRQQFIHTIGHGIGREVHEPPFVRGKREPLKPGAVITIEPGLYYRGRHGARLENMVVVTTTGYEFLTHTPRELVRIG